MKTSIQHKLDNLAERFDEIAALLAEPDVQNEQNRFRALSQDMPRLTRLLIVTRIT